jgi:periplasmic protein TonB
MSDPHNHKVQFARRHAPSALTPALMFSLAVHAAAGGILFQHWRHTAVELPQTLTVTLEVVPPVIVESPPPAVEIKQATPAPKSRALPVPQLHYAPAPSLIAVERVEATPAAVAAPLPEAPLAPVVVAAGPANVPASHHADAVEPPHFNVAYLNNPRPAYPPIARKLGLEGIVLLRVDVNAKGAPEKIVIAQTSGASLLDEAAMKAVQGWTFVPARRGDTPIAHPVEVPIRFQLKN